MSGIFARAGCVAALAVGLLAGGEAVPQTIKPPQTLQETGLYADSAALRVDPGHLAFAPQYPLWTDGAAKRRWISLPAGAAIDASDPDAWVFPIGTRLWKEFSFAGQRIETRYIERKPDGQWLYAAYAWSPDGREATLAPERGKRNAFALGGGRAHAIPGVTDCKACHQGGRSEVLGFSALQLSPERDPNAPHAEASGLDLPDLIARGLLVGLPASLVSPRITAESATERAVLGYLHGNCAHCHNERGPLSNLGLFLRQPLDASSQAVATTWAHPMKKPAPGQSPDAVSRIEPGHPERSALLQRIASRYPALQMPPLGTALVDQAAVELLRRWILEADEITPSQKGPRP